MHRFTAAIRVVAAVVLCGGTAPTAVLLSAGSQQRPTPEPAKPVVVLVFSNITGDAADDWIGVGIAEALANGLNGVGGLTVIRTGPSETGTPTGRDVESPVAVGQALEVRWVVSGTYQRVANRLRLTATVIEVATGVVRHAATADGVMTELFSLQDQLSNDLGQGLPFNDAGVASAGAARAPTDRAERVATPASSPGIPPAVSLPAEASPERVSGREAASSRVIDGPPPPVPPETIVRDAAGRVTVRAVALDGPLEINGTLDEEVYGTVPALSGFIQQMPNEGQPATERTEAWVLYDESNIYVSARVWNSVPESQWIANEMQRDSFQLINNDSISVTFDTFYDRRNAFGFMVNPIGGFFDMQLTNEGNPNQDWNPIWDVQTGRFDGGWSVEMQIPFKSIRFQPGESQVWGLQLGRTIRWKNESVYLTPVSIAAQPGMFRVSASATMTGLEVPAGNRTFEIKPYAIGSLATDRNAVPLINNKGAGDFGVDVKYGLTENLTADLTYNTDFAQVEVDEQQVNLTRFSLFFPEKREFFLEGRGIFDFGRGVIFGGMGGGPGGGGRPGSMSFFGGGDVPTIFFSRRIGLESGRSVPILGGGRLTGKVGDFTVGALNIQTDDASSLDVASTNFTTLRVKRDLLRRSSVGAIFTGRSVSIAGDGSNEVYGVDGVFSFYDNLNFSGYYARSETPGLDGENESYQGVFTYNGDLYAVGIDHLLVGDNFNPEMGFIRRDDFRRTFVQAQYSPRPSGLAAVRQFTWGGSLDYIETVGGGVESRIAKGSFETEFENSDRFMADVQQNYEFLETPFRISSDVTIPVGGYQFQDYFASYQMGAQRRLSGSLTFQRGEFYDGDITAVGYSRGRIEITPQFSFEPSVSVNRITLPQGTFTTKLATSRITYTLTPRMFFSGLLQYNSTQNVLSTNFRLRWEYQPGSELFIVYNDQRDTAVRNTPMLQNRAFVVKFTRLFRS